MVVADSLLWNIHFFNYNMLPTTFNNISICIWEYKNFRCWCMYVGSFQFTSNLKLNCFFRSSVLSLERSVNSALLLSLTGVRCLLANQWECTLKENAQRIDVLMKGRWLSCHSWESQEVYNIPFCDWSYTSLWMKMLSILLCI